MLPGITDCDGVDVKSNGVESGLSGSFDHKATVAPNIEESTPACVLCKLPDPAARAPELLFYFSKITSCGALVGITIQYTYLLRGGKRVNIYSAAFRTSQ